MRNRSLLCLTLSTGLGLSSLCLAQSAADFKAAFASEDTTRCMEAGNTLSEHRDLAAELGPALIEILASGTGCTDSALSGLVNLGDGISETVPATTAVPLLIGILERGLESNYDSNASSALLIVGRWGADAGAAVPILERWLNEREDSFDRRYALGALAEIGDPAAAAIDSLLVWLGPSDDDSYERNETRTEVARTLAHIPAAAGQSAPALVGALASEDWTLRSIASETLTALGSAAVPAIVTELSADDAERRTEAAKILGGIGSGATQAAPALAGQLTDEDWNVRYEASEALLAIGPTEEGLGAITKVLAGASSEDSRQAAVELLGQYGNAARGALPALKKALEDESWSVRDAAKTAIAQIE